MNSCCGTKFTKVMEMGGYQYGIDTENTGMKQDDRIEEQVKTHYSIPYMGHYVNGWADLCSVRRYTRITVFTSESTPLYLPKNCLAVAIRPCSAGNLPVFAVSLADAAKGLLYTSVYLELSNAG